MRQDFRISAAQGQVTLGELLGAFSYALDLTEGQPAGHCIRACWIGTRIANAMGIQGQALADIYYAVLLKDLGCSSNAARLAQLYIADDRGFKHRSKTLDGTTKAALRFVFAETGSRAPFHKRIAAIANIMRNGPEITRSLVKTRCTRGADIARQLRFGEPVAMGIQALDEHWDGSGKPRGLAGEQIPLAARIALMAQVIDVFNLEGGPDAARIEVEARAGSWFDPELVRTFLTISRDPVFWVMLEDPMIEARVLTLAPAEAILPVDEDFLDDIAAAFGQVIDAKSPYTGGHSDRVGRYTRVIGRHVGLDERAIRPLSRAAALHDIGKLGVSSLVLEKPGALDEAEWRVMRSHASLTQQVLGRIAVFGDLADIAGSHHERLDGTGYPQGLSGDQIPRETRIISIADYYDALTADRPYRAAMLPDEALAIMARDIGGAIDPDCFAALRELAVGGALDADLPRTPELLVANG